MSLDVSLTIIKPCEVFCANVTHNLEEMANKAGIYHACWHPEDIGAKQAKDIIPVLEIGLAEMEARPQYYKQFDSPNGWGTYNDFVPWVRRYLEACREHPEAVIEVNR